ncbi:hypothetical protein V6C32_10720 [Desulforamulus ruminis]|uniref:hypothetical protein n=1 Tax=Desulforamulus ruminis TaxID=1564 RepID=UPI002FDAE8ED
MGKHKLIDYTKRRKENPKKNILKCPLCDKLGRMVEIAEGQIQFIHTETVRLMQSVPGKVCNMPKIFLEQYKVFKK